MMYRLETLTCWQFRF